MAKQAQVPATVKADPEKSKRARHALTKARTLLLVGQPFFGCLALHLQLVEVSEGCGLPQQMIDNIKTMAVDGFNLYYDVDFTLGLSEQELLGVVAHECLHVAYLHFCRAGNRDRKLWNVAGDFVINDDLKTANFQLPGKAINGTSAKGEQGHLHDPKYAGMSSEEVYEDLMQNAKKIKINLSSMDAGGCGGVIDPEQGGHSKEESEKAKHEWEATVRMAVNVAQAANAGQIPAYLQRLVKQLEAPKVSWRDLTKHFIDQSMIKDYSFRKPNRRYLSQGLIMPGFVPDALHKMVFLGDVSGSISERIMRAYVSEIAGALDDNTADSLVVAYFDTEIKEKVYEFTPGDVVDCEIPGGGGTDYRPAFQWVLDKHPDTACVIMLTDMMPCDWHLPDMGQLPVMMASYGNPDFCASAANNQMPHGFTHVHVDSID